MARLSINEMTTYRWTFEEDVQHYAAAGVGALGVWRGKLSDFGEEKGIELLRDSGLRVSSLLWAGGFTGSDGRSFRDSVDDASEAVRLAGAMQAECLVVYSGARGGHTHNHARRLLKAALTELVPLAIEQNITLAVEPMHAASGTDCTFLHSLDDALAILSGVGSDRLKLAFDTYHWCHEASVLDRLGELAPHIGLVHLADGQGPPDGEQSRLPLGRGSLPLREIIAALERAGYRGYCEVELLGEEIEAADNFELLAQTQQAFGELTRGL